MAQPPAPRTSRSSQLRTAGCMALEPGSPTQSPDSGSATPTTSKRVILAVAKEEKDVEPSPRPSTCSSTASSETSAKKKGFFGNKEARIAVISSSQGARVDDSHLAPMYQAMKDAHEAGGRRRSLPCLKVDTKKPTQKEEPRRVSFGGGGPEMFEAFTPYCKKYGAHPAEFYFDAEGHMVLEGGLDSDDESDLDKVKVGDTIECNVDCGVGYRTKPQFAARFADYRTLEVGTQVKVTQRCGAWIRDDVGWLPLTIKDNPVFELIVPKDKLKFITPRVPVLACSGDDPSSPKIAGKSPDRKKEK